MKLLLDDKQHRGCDLNANEACIFAAILKCTRAGRGWYGNYRELAAALPFVISDETVRRAVNKLLNMGLIKKRENALFATPQNVVDTPQNVVALPQIVADAPQNVAETDSPYNPLINKEIMNENEHATCAQACDTRTPESPSFGDLLNAFKSKGGKVNNYESGEAIDAWQLATPAKRIKLLAAVKSGAHFKPRLDWLIADFPEPLPHFLSGQEQDRLREQGIPLVQVKYNGKFLICTRETMELFGLEWVRDW